MRGTRIPAFVRILGVKPSGARTGLRPIVIGHKELIETYAIRFRRLNKKVVPLRYLSESIDMPTVMTSWPVDQGRRKRLSLAKARRNDDSGIV